MRFDFASTTQTMAQKFIGTELTGGTCVGCHALSHDGKKLVAEAGGQNDGRLLLLDVATQMPMVAFGSTPKSIFESWDADGGALRRRLRRQRRDRLQPACCSTAPDGALLGDIAGTGTATNPPITPTGRSTASSIAYVKVGTPGTIAAHVDGRDRDGHVARRHDVVGADGAGAVDAGQEPLLPGVRARRQLPRLRRVDLPAGQPTRTARATATPTRRRRCGRSAPRPGATPVDARACNAGGVADGGTTALTNSFPKWNPFVFQRIADGASSRLEWLTFSSTRNYGLRPPPPSAPRRRAPVGHAHLDGGDRSRQDRHGAGRRYAAFALPFQDITTSNHIAQWTKQVVGGIP